MTTFPGVAFHRPAAPSRGAVLDVGLSCPHACVFCYYSFLDGEEKGQFAALRRAKLRDAASCLEIVRALAANGLTHCDITGGEPTTHKALPAIVAGAVGHGLAVRCITLGQLLLRDAGEGRLLDRLLDAGLTDLLFSVHAARPESFRAACGGSLATTLAALDVLDAQGFEYAWNTVLLEGNRRELPAIARLAVARGAYAVNFIAFNAYHAWRRLDRAAALAASYAAIRPYLEEAVAILTAGHVAVNIRYVPLCAFPSLARHVVGVLGVPFDPYEWRNRCLNHDQPPAYCAEVLPLPGDGVRAVHAFSPLDEALADGTRLCGMRGERFKLFPARCRDCPARAACDGVDPVYLARHGAGEFLPLDAATRGPLLVSRLDYLPPFCVKMKPHAPMRRAIAACSRSEPEAAPC